MTLSLTQWLSHGFLAFAGKTPSSSTSRTASARWSTRPKAVARKVEGNVREASPSTSARTDG